MDIYNTLQSPRDLHRMGVACSSRMSLRDFNFMDIEDAIQDALLRTIENNKSCVTDKYIDQQFLNNLKYNSNLRELDGTEPTLEIESRRITKMDVRSAVKKLTDGSKTLVEMYMDGCTWDEIGTHFGITKQAAEQQFNRIKRTLKRNLLAYA